MFGYTGRLLFIRKYKYDTWKKIVIWCHANLSFGKDFYYHNEEVRDGDNVYIWPIYLWLTNEEDLVALSLAIKLE
jgi:hypothetical protein